ncbi:hypothetical protein [Dactylosporangium fulvum]|uniref:hypothetical protein n=1 Tax=Dactylosporangium fulvum TaxID=53359 RepID=UPI0031D0674D
MLLALAGCSDQLGDRGGKEGAAPDKISDVDYVEVYRNADNFPNVALVCIRGIAFATTASREGMSAPALIRMQEWDARCRAVTGGASQSPAPATPSASTTAGSPSPAS